MISIGSIAVEKAISKYKLEISEYRKKTLYKLIYLEKSIQSSIEKKYLKKIINEFRKDDIVIGKLEYLENVKSDIGEIPIDVTLPTEKKRYARRIVFKESILKALDYKGLRDKFYPKYFKEIGIKTCVYCNSQLAVSIDVEEFLKTKTKIVVKAKFQVDHYLAKDEYPFLAISLYNLYPACSSCNIAKSKIQIKDFKLYSDSNLPNKYHFEFASGCVAKYLTTFNFDDIKVLFIDPDKPNSRLVEKGSFQDTFDIEGIYDTQKDIAEEMIIKSQIYNETFRRRLVNDFGTLLPNESYINRILLGNYLEKENIYKRPMAKYIQDLAIELGLQ